MIILITIISYIQLEGKNITISLPYLIRNFKIETDNLYFYRVEKNILIRRKTTRKHFRILQAAKETFFSETLL